MRIDRIDHVVLTVRDLGATLDFYTRVLGMQEITFGNGRKALHFGRQKLNLQEVGREAPRAAVQPTPGSADLCFVTTMPLAEVVAHLEANGVAILEGPVRKTGALGTIESVYFHDPDRNLIEVSNYRDEVGTVGRDEALLRGRGGAPPEGTGAERERRGPRRRRHRGGGRGPREGGPGEAGPAAPTGL